MRAGDEVPGLVRKFLEFPVHGGFQFFHIFAARLLDVCFPWWSRSEMRFPGRLVRLHQFCRSSQLHRVLQGDLESSEEDYNQHRFVGGLDMLTVCLELQKLSIEIISVHLESAELFS